ncbi:MAG: hypothetical protein K6A44_03735 [bacterium]|nr:hypothetical protein [bacterium]
MKVNHISNTYRYNTAFCSRQDVITQSENFADEIIGKANSGNIRLSDAQKIAATYVPGIKIRKFAKSEDRYDSIGGVYGSHYVYLDTPDRVETINRLIKIRLNGASPRAFKEKIISLAHEMTHAIQSTDDQLADDRLITASLKKYPLKNWPHHVLVAGETFDRIEKKILEPMIFAHNDLRVNNGGANPYDIFVNRDAFKKSVAKIIDDAKRRNPDVDSDFLKKYVCLQAIYEFDAYMLEENVKKKLYGVKNYKMDDFIPYLYLSLLDCVDCEKEFLL